VAAPTASEAKAPISSSLTMDSMLASDRVDNDYREATQESVQTTYSRGPLEILLGGTPEERLGPSDESSNPNCRSQKPGRDRRALEEHAGHGNDRCHLSSVTRSHARVVRQMQQHWRKSIADFSVEARP
jgi:hypothetical protein